MDKSILRVHASDFSQAVRELVQGSGPIHFRGKDGDAMTDEETEAAAGRTLARADAAFLAHLDRLIAEA
ncbi:MAG: hypothetical protein WC457_04615 [Patescibacteria group bacterium]